MAKNQYDAIVVGARCAGSPTAMLLARKGYKVLVTMSERASVERVQMLKILGAEVVLTSAGAPGSAPGRTRINIRP